MPFIQHIGRCNPNMLVLLSHTNEWPPSYSLATATTRSSASSWLLLLLLLLLLPIMKSGAASASPLRAHKYRATN
jgi:hypothetical protein